MIGGIFVFILTRLLCRRGRRHYKCENRSIENNQITQENIVKKEKCCRKKEEKIEGEKTAPQVEKKLVKEKVPTEPIVEKSHQPEPKQKKSIPEKKATEVKISNEKQITPTSNENLKIEDDGEWVVAKKGKNKAY
jgi:hypothetical protein